MVVIAPLVAAAGIQAVGGLAEGFLGNAAKQQMAANDRAFQTFAAQQSAANNIMGLNASLGQGMSNNRWANMLGPDADQLRQFTAAKQKAAFLDPLEDARERENARWTMGASLDPLSKKTGFEALLNANRRSGFDKLVASDAMFGPTGFSNRFTRNA